MKACRRKGWLLLGIILMAGVTARAQAPAAATAASAERKQAEKSESPSAWSQLPPALLTVGARAWEEGNAEGIGDIMLPVYSTRSGLFFLNPKSAVRGDENEFNLGVGYRQLLGDRKMILGANAYYDRRETEANNHFNQAGFGVEFLSEWVDARVNYYLPDHAIKDASITAQGEPVDAAARTIQWEQPYGDAHAVYQSGVRVDSQLRLIPYTRYIRQEQAMEGFDCEIGVRLPIPVVKDWSDVKLFAGYYRYDNDLANVIEGWKGRLEVRALPSLYLDAELYDDDELNGSSYYVGTRLQVPFDMAALVNNKNPFAGAIDGFKPARRGARPFDARLNEMVIRDPRIQTGFSPIREVSQWTVSELLAQTQKKIKDTLDSSMIYVDKDNATGIEDGSFEHPFNTISEGLKAAGGDFKTVYVFDSATPYQEKLLVAADGISLIGSGSGLAANGGYRFATGIYPVLRGGKYVKRTDPLSELATLNIMADDVLVSGFEFRGRLMESIADLLKSKRFAASAASLINGKLPSIDIGLVLQLLQAGVQLSGILALDANNLMVYDNVFNNHAAGVLSINGPFKPGDSSDAKPTLIDPHTAHILTVANNRFEQNAIGVLSIGVGDADILNKNGAPAPRIPSSVTVAGNAFQDNLIGAAIGQIGAGLNVMVADNTFNNIGMPAGIGVVIGNYDGTLNARVAGNTIQGNHTIGLGIIQEQGDMSAVISDNVFRDCQLMALAVEANAGQELIDMLKTDSPDFDVSLALGGNVIAGTGRDIKLDEDWLNLLDSSKDFSDTIPLPDAPAAAFFLAGRNVTLSLTDSEFTGNKGGALLGGLMAKENLDVTVTGIGGSDNGPLFGKNDLDLGWEEEFPRMEPMADYSFLIAGQAKGTITSRVENNGLLNSGLFGVFLQEPKP